jgi:hypothetical protein
VLRIAALLLVVAALGRYAGAADGERTPLPPPGPGEIRSLSCIQLGNFPYDPQLGGHIPADVLALDGLHVKMRGTVTPWDLNGEKVVRFALTDGQSCCFGGPPRIQHVVVVSCPGGMDLALADGWVLVDGILHVHEDRSDGFTLSLFSLTATAVVATVK